MTGLREWSTAYQADAQFNSIDFYGFLPKAGDETPGKAYWLYKPHLEPWQHGKTIVNQIHVFLYLWTY